MQIVKPRSTDDIMACVDLYFNLNDPSFLTPCKSNCYKNLLQFAKQNKFIRLKLDDNNKIVAWIFAAKVQSYHSDSPMFQQMYYASSNKGVKAYRDVVDLHNAMIVEAEQLKLSLVISQGSHMDENNTFSRILEKNGWERRGHTALKRLVIH
jgi:hypothetical protein